jgi:hypothetical protein
MLNTKGAGCQQHRAPTGPVVPPLRGKAVIATHGQRPKGPADPYDTMPFLFQSALEPFLTSVRE